MIAPAEAARRYLAEAGQTPVSHLPPSVLQRELAEVRQLLGQVLAGADGQDCTDTAVAALARAHQAGGDFCGWLAMILARLAARLGSSAAVTAGRPGSWEASLVRQLLAGTVGEGDEHLDAYAGKAGQP